MIQRVQLVINPWNMDKAIVAKCLSMLASRARRGALREVTLVVQRFGKAASWRQMSYHEYAYITWYQELLVILESSAEAGWGKVQRWVAFDERCHALVIWEMPLLHKGNVAAGEHLALAWGGTFWSKERARPEKKASTESRDVRSRYLVEPL